MSAGTPKTTTARRQRRIIERPRLIKMLDEADARVILLLAPAGYGKTTLARQWAKTLNGAIWLGLSPAHRDVATVAEELAKRLAESNAESERFIGEFIRARSNPQRASREIATVLAAHIDQNRVNWLLIDDFHEVADSEEVVDLLKSVIEQTSARVLLSSRVRPQWASSRRLVYGEFFELSRDDLALTPEEVSGVLGPRDDLRGLAAQAKGWPAVVSLATRLSEAAPPAGLLPATLHAYVAQELFDSASSELQDALITIALLPDLSPEALATSLGPTWRTSLDAADELGFVLSAEQPELHPLLRDFLLAKLRELPGAASRVTEAIGQAAALGRWEQALDLVMRFDVPEFVEPIFSAAYQPLLRSGRLGTLTRFASALNQSPSAPPILVDLVDAEVALHDGHFELAADLGERVRVAIGSKQPLASRAGAIVGQSRFLLADFEGAEDAFTFARDAARDDLDACEALHGLAVTRIFGEREGAAEAVEAIAGRQHLSATDLARYMTDALSLRSFADDLNEPLHLDHTRHALSRVEDPRVRTAVTYRAAYLLALRSEYKEAEDWLRLFFADATTFMLDFTLPYARWVDAFINLGLRRFGHAERSIQFVEDAAAAHNNKNHLHNAKSIRARLLLQSRQPDEALSIVCGEPAASLIPSWLGEYVATRSLALACAGRHDEAERQGDAAVRISRALEVRMLALGARAVVAVARGESPAFLIAESVRTSTWDPTLCALRASPELAAAVASIEELRPPLESLYARSNDRALAKRSGFRTRAHGSPDAVLTTRELEVLGLIARGFRNRQIAKALFIAESTTKVHIRHVFEKLGVRTRAEAVARYEMFARRGEGLDSSAGT